VNVSVVFCIPYACLQLYCCVIILQSLSFIVTVTMTTLSQRKPASAW